MFLVYATALDWARARGFTDKSLSDMRQSSKVLYRINTVFPQEVPSSSKNVLPRLRDALQHKKITIPPEIETLLLYLIQS